MLRSGAQGGGDKGWQGGSVSAIWPVTGGDSIQVNVGGQGTNVSAVDRTAAGPLAAVYRRGRITSVAAAVSDIRIGGSALGDRKFVAGGGGGGGDQDGEGGALAGTDGIDGILAYTDTARRAKVEHNLLAVLAGCDR